MERENEWNKRALDFVNSISREDLCEFESLQEYEKHIRAVGIVIIEKNGNAPYMKHDIMIETSRGAFIPMSCACEKIVRTQRRKIVNRLSAKKSRKRAALEMDNLRSLVACHEKREQSLLRKSEILEARLVVSQLKYKLLVQETSNSAGKKRRLYNSV